MLKDETVAVVGARVPQKATPFRSVLEQVQEELRWLSLRLRVVVARGRSRRSVGPPAEYRGLYVSDEEVDHLLVEDGPEADEIGGLRRDAADFRKYLDERAAATVGAGLELPLDRITTIFELTPAERMALVACLGPNFDHAYEKVFAYANDDIAKKRPTVALILEILSDSREEALSLRSLFYIDAPLSKNYLARVADDRTSGSSPLLTRFVELDEHVAEVLLGYEGLDPRVHSVAELAQADGEHRDGEQLARVLSRREDARVYLGGRWRAEKLSLAASACRRAGLGVITVDTPSLQQSGTVSSSLLPILLREARRLRAGLYLSDWGEQARGSSDVGESFGTSIAPIIRRHPLPVFFSGVGVLPEQLPTTLDLQLEIALPSYAALKCGWDEALAGTDPPLDTSQVTATFRLGSDGINSAVRMAESFAEWRTGGPVSADDLRTAARLQSLPRLTTLAQKISPHFTWDDIVLPGDRLAQMREMVAQVLYQHVVYDEWGFGAKTSLGRGVAALFAGQSGTGKTMAAEIIAGELGLDLYKIDLSGLVSKYIGETEKNLARLFDEAGDSSAILFFDEADAVFGKRTEVRDSHDRYANIEVSYLLQKMEAYDGIVVLASNLRSNIDESFLRRMRAIVEFPFPEEDDRLRIWQRTLSASAPVADDIDLPFMARQFRIAGGNIKNIVLLAAFLAAEAGEPIAMAHLIRAAKREYQKLGRLVTKSDFAGWYEEVRG